MGKMKTWMIILLMPTLILCITLTASADSLGGIVHHRATIRVTTGDTGPGIRFHDPRGVRRKVRPCFPYSCGGVGEQQVNPNPRTELEKPACYYGGDNVLFFEKKGSNCTYIQPASANELRIEKRRQEWLLRKVRKDSPRLTLR